MEIIEILKAILFGIVEGITEWLPVSSTGHMILLDELVKLDVTDEFMSMFLVVIQLGAILAVVVLYFPQLWPFSTKERFFIKKDTAAQPQYLFCIIFFFLQDIYAFLFLYGCSLVSA